MGQNQSSGATAYSRPLIQGLPDALPNFSIKLPKPQTTLSLTFPALDWEYLEKPLHISCKARHEEVAVNPTEELKHWKPLANPYVAGVLSATFPKIPNPETKKMEWMRHPLADAWFFEVTDACAFGGLWDGNGGALKGWAAAHLAMLQTRATIWNHLRHHKVKSSVDAAKVLEAALMASHDQIIKVDDAQSTTALLFFLVQLDEARCGMVYAAVGDVELYCYSHHKGGWMSLMQPFGDLRFKEVCHKHQVEGGIGNGFGHFGQLKSGMNLQYGAVLLAPDDVVLAASDGLGDVLDPIAAKVPPKQFGLRFADWQQFAKQHALDGPTTVQELKMQRLQEALGNVAEPVQGADIKAVVDKAAEFAMANTAGERALYADHANRNENGKVVTERVDKKRLAGLMAGNYTYAKMDHLGIVAFSPRCLSVPKPASGSSEHSIGRSSSSVADQLKLLGDRLTMGLGRRSQTPK